MLHTQWPAIKFQYEIMGKSVEALAREFNVGVAQIKYARDEENWNQIPLHDPLAEATEISEEVIANVQDRVEKLRSMKNASLAPYYITLETEILTKARELLTGITADQPDAVAKIKQLTDVLGSLRTQVGDNQATAGSGEKTMTVRILTSASGKDGRVQQAIEVRTAGSPKQLCNVTQAEED